MSAPRTIHQADLLAAAERAGIDSEAAERLWSELPEPSTPAVPARPAPRYSETAIDERIVSLLVYAGGVVVLGALFWWIGITQADSPGTTMAIALLEIAGFTAGALWLRRIGVELASGICATVAVALVPVAIGFGLRLAGVNIPAPFGSDSVHPGRAPDAVWVVMELATIAAGLVALRIVRAPLVMVPIVIAAVMFGIDLSVRLAPHPAEPTGFGLAAVGLLCIAGATLLDQRGLRPFGFWPQLAGGLLLVFASLSAGDGFSTEGCLLLSLSGVGLLAAGVLLGRMVHLAVGGLALYAGLTGLAWDHLGAGLPQLLFVTLSGIALIVLGVLVARSRGRIRGMSMLRPRHG